MDLTTRLLQPGVLAEEMRLPVAVPAARQARIGKKTPAVDQAQCRDVAEAALPAAMRQIANVKPQQRCWAAGPGPLGRPGSVITPSDD